jgi:hypothetical protein
MRVFQMNRKLQVAGLCTVFILGIIGYGLLTREGDHVPQNENAERPGVQAKAVPPSELSENVTSATLPVAPVGEEKKETFRIRVMWLDTNQPVEGATVTLIPEQNEKVLGKTNRTESFPKATDKTDKPEGTDKPAITLTGQTDMAGNLSLKCPPDLTTTGTLRCQVKAEHPGAVPASYQGVAVSDSTTFNLTMQRAYGYFGTVYRRDTAGKFIPAPGATVSAVPVSTRLPGQSSPPATATSDAEGHYTIVSLPENIVYLWGQLDDQVTVEAKTPVMGKSGERSGPFDLYLEQGTSLAALVSDKTTLKPISGATVEVKFAGALSRSAMADSEGFCEVKGLPLGRIVVFARAEGYAEEFVPMDVSTDSKSNAVPFFLDQGGRVRILTVGAADNKPLAHVPLQVCGNTIIEVVSDSEGIAMVDGLKPAIKWGIIPVGDYTNPGGKVSAHEIPTFIPDLQKTVEITVLVANKMMDTSRHRAENADFFKIEGTVFNELGEPVPGAIVTATSKCCSTHAATNASGEFLIENACVEIFTSSNDPLPDLEKVKEENIVNEGRDIILSHREYYLPRPDFVLSSGSVVSCYIGPVTLDVKADGYVPVKNIRNAIDKKTRIILTGKTDGEARVVVTDSETKQPITDYWVHFNGGDQSTRVCTQDGVRVQKNLVPEQTYSFTVKAMGYVEKTIEKKIEKDSSQNRIDFSLEHNKKLQILVLDSETRLPIEGMEIHYIRSDRIEDFLRVCKKLSNIPSVHTFVTDSKGEFQFTLATPASCLIFLPTQHTPIAIPLKEIEQYRDSKSGKIVIPLEKSNASVSVTLLQGQGSFLKPDSITLKRVDNKVVTDSLANPIVQNGTFQWTGLSSGEYEISGQAAGPDYREVKVSFKLSVGENRTIRIEENNSASLSGRVFQPAGTALPSASLTIESESEQNGERIQWQYFTRSDENGNFRFMGIAPGTCKIRELKSRYSETIRVEGNTIRDFIIPKDVKVGI